MSTPLVTPWSESAAPTQSTLWQRMAQEGLSPYSWSNGPFDVYAAHSHSYNKASHLTLS